MKRSELRRGPGPDRKTPIKPRNHKRAAKRRDRDFGAERDGVRKSKWIEGFVCEACGKDGPSDPHHHPTRAAGGRSEDMSPLCKSNPATGYEGCHDLYHRVGPETFQRTKAIDLTATNAKYEAMWQNGDEPF